MNKRTLPIGVDEFNKLVDSHEDFYQGIDVLEGYLIPLKGFEVTVMMQTFDIRLLYQMYKAYHNSQIWHLKRHRTSHIAVYQDHQTFYFDMVSYHTEQDKALEYAKANGYDYVVSIHGKDNIYMKTTGTSK